MVSTLSGSPTKPRSITFSMRESGSAHGARDLARHHHVAVLAGEPDGAAAGLVDEADELLVDRAGQHHLDDLDGLLVGDAQAAGELRLDAEPLEHVADLRAAAMHHHRIDGGLLHQHDVAREARGRSPRRPWRGRRISPRRSRRRSAACAAALRTGCGRCRAGKRPWVAARNCCGVFSGREARRGRASRHGTPGRRSPRSASSRRSRRAVPAMPAPLRADVASDRRERRRALGERRLGRRDARSRARRASPGRPWSARPGSSPPPRRAS